MRHDFVTTVVRTDIPQAGAARRYEMKNWRESRMKELPRKKSPLLRITTGTEDQIMDRNNGLEVRIPKEGTTTIITMGLGGIPPKIARISLQDQTSYMGIIAQTMEDPLINAQISHLIETM